MKIREIKFDNKPILGNLNLDFVNHQTGSPFDTILLIGENGSGKTTILSAINKFLGGAVIKGLFSSLKYNIENEIYEIRPSTHDVREFACKIIHNGNVSTHMRGTLNNTSYGREEIARDPNDPRYYGSIISLPRSYFNTRDITSTGVSEVDKSNHDADINEDFTSLKQLLVDLSTADDREFSSKHRNGDAIEWSSFEPESRMYRFVYAFNNFFDNIQFSDISGDGKKIEIYFKKRGIKIPIDSLSTGEKQIVYKGIYLLKNINLLKGGVILIDEPELSLHPKWQDRILKYYQNLFTDPVSGMQQVQLIIASHSERILASAFMDPQKNNVIILTDNNGIIEANQPLKPAVLPTTTAAETAYRAFDITSIDYHIELYGYIQHLIELNTCSAPNISETDVYIRNHRSYNRGLYEKIDTFTNRYGRPTTYETLPTYVRNRINHPSSNPANNFTLDQLRKSTEFLREIIQNP